MGYSPDTLPNIIYNTRNPQYETLRKIADYLGCHISEFFYDEPITHHGEVVKTKDSLEIANGQPHLRIRSVMRMQGVTSVALAEKLGISKVGVSVMLKSNNPTVERLIQIADALGVCVTDLFSYDENEN